MSEETISPSAALEPSIELPEAIGEQLAVSEAEEPARVFRRGFRIGELNLLLSEETVCEIMDLPSISRVPNTARWLLGLVNRRGDVVPVFDLARLLLGFGVGNERGGKLLVIGQGDAAAGIVVDGLPTLESFPADERIEQSSPIPPALDGYVTDCFVKDGTQWFELTYERFFLSLGEKVADDCDCVETV